jgi:gamma-glutamyltranspeptidase
MIEDSKAHRPVITGRHGMVSTGHSLASCEALYVLKKGGNAMDAALAAAGVLSVIKSYHCGLGGDLRSLSLILASTSAPERFCRE